MISEVIWAPSRGIAFAPGCRLWWRVAGQCWSSHWMGCFMGCSWDFHGMFMGFSWDFHGIFMGLSWDFHGIFMGFRRCLWDFHGFKDLFWDFNGILMGSQWDLMRFNVMKWQSTWPANPRTKWRFRWGKWVIFQQTMFDNMRINVWLVVWNMNFIFLYIGNNNPNWLSYFSEGGLNHQPDVVVNFNYIYLRIKLKFTKITGSNNRTGFIIQMELSSLALELSREIMVRINQNGLESNEQRLSHC